jgi:hypothetical protein
MLPRSSFFPINRVVRMCVSVRKENPLFSLYRNSLFLFLPFLGSQNIGHRMGGTYHKVIKEIMTI